MFILEFNNEDQKIMHYRTLLSDRYLIITSDKNGCFQCTEPCSSISTISFVEKKTKIHICERCIFKRIEWLDFNKAVDNQKTKF